MQKPLHPAPDRITGAVRIAIPVSAARDSGGVGRTLADLLGSTGRPSPSVAASCCRQNSVRDRIRHVRSLGGDD